MSSEGVSAHPPVEFDLRLRGLLESVPDAMIIVDGNGSILLVNALAEHLFGYPRAELMGRPVEDLVPVHNRDRHTEKRSAYGSGPHTRQMGIGMELRARRKDGTELPVEISLSPLQTDKGILIASAIRDITQRKALEEKLRRQHDELVDQYRRLEQANRMKSEFLANMSHELRTPLNAIIGFAELMHDGKVGGVSEEQKEYLGDILTSSRHLLRVINDVLDLAKVESGKVEFRPQPVDLREVVEEVCDILRGLAAQEHVQIEVSIDPSVRSVIGDPSKLKQVLYNYLSNALKFSRQEGSVRVRVIPEGEDEFRIEVEDAGIGIRPEDFGRLFVEFQQLDAGVAKRYPGTGLGLALTKHIVEAQRGRVGVRSSAGQGSVFFAVLPRRYIETKVDVPARGAR